MFRFPYLKEGNTPEKVNQFRQLLKDHNYLNGHVTIDASDWYIESRMKKFLRKDSTGGIEGYKKYYLDHIFDRANYYEKMSFEMTGRHIPHTLLLHHNLVSALFLDDLIALFEKKGWEIIDAEKAYQDEIFKQLNPSFPPGESLIWSMANQLETHCSNLRYPAEDGRYEKPKMDLLGL